MNHSFRPLDGQFRHSDATGISDVRIVNGTSFIDFTPGTTFLYVFAGSVNYKNQWYLTAGMYAAFTTGHIITSEDSVVLLINKPEYNAMPMAGGPIERVGRLKYIDGCTDSLLIPPVKLGDPCLNHLHFPAGIRQTMHTHPSIRLGIVTSGRGECVTPFGNIELLPGMAFAIMPENGLFRIGSDGEQHLVGSHCFYTEDSEMNVIAFHPDSDFGPTDEEHPMLNRTMVNGVSAKNIAEIRTK